MSCDTNLARRSSNSAWSLPLFPYLQIYFIAFIELLYSAVHVECPHGPYSMFMEMMLNQNGSGNSALLHVSIRFGLISIFSHSKIWSCGRPPFCNSTVDVTADFPDYLAVFLNMFIRAISFWRNTLASRLVSSLVFAQENAPQLFPVTLSCMWKFWTDRVFRSFSHIS